MQPEDEDSERSQLLTVAEVQRRLRTSRSWVYAAVRERRLPHVRIGGPAGPIRFLESDIDALIRAGYVDAKDVTLNDLRGGRRKRTSRGDTHSV